MTLVRRLIRTELAHYKGALLTRFLIAACVAASPYAFSFLGKWLVDEAIQVTGPPKVAARPAGAPAPPPVSVAWRARTTDDKLRLLAVFLGASLGIHVVVTALSALSELLNSRTVQEMTHRLRSRVHEKIARLEMRLFSREQVGQLMTRTLDDTGGIPGNLTNLVINTCTQVAMLALGLVLLVRLNPKMTLVPLAALPFYAVVCVIFLPRLRRSAIEARERGAAFSGHVVERLSNIATVKNYAQEERELATFSDMLDGNLDVARSQHRQSLLFGSLTTIITASSTLAVLAFGFLNLQAQRMQLGEVLAFYQVTAQLFVPISALVGMTTVAQTLEVLAERVYGILDTEETVVDAPDAVEPTDLNGEVAFENVSLRYQEGGPFAVRNVSLTIPAGSVACIVGPTGCGKSTLLTLLTRLYDPTEGTLRIDGTDVREFRVNALRRAIGNILHQPGILSGSIAENICYGAPDASQDDVEAVARIVELHDFVAALPDGYGTRLGRGGITLSAEQLVKLGIARALITRPAIVTIDDTFSAIDEDVEKRLRAALRTALAGRTVLIATSRLSICHDADLVVVMQKGSIAETGTHEELLARPGIYRRMFLRQMGIEAADRPSP